MSHLQTHTEEATRCPADWYVQYRDREPVAEAMRSVQRGHLMKTVRNALDANKKSGKTPCSMKEFALSICRDRNNIRRRDQVSASEYYAMASVLNISVTEFFMDETDWLWMTILELVACVDEFEAKLASQFYLTAAKEQTIESAATGNKAILRQLAEKLHIEPRYLASIESRVSNQITRLLTDSERPNEDIKKPR